jgi:hypothetical protein
VPPGCFNLRDPQVIQRFDRALRLTDGGSKCCEIMLAQQQVRCGLHGLDVQLFLDLPDQPVLMGGRGTAHQNPKQIAPFQRPKPRMKIIRHWCAGCDRHGMRFQVVIQGFGQAECSPISLHVTMGNLTQCMNAFIGASGGGNIVITGFEFGQGRLDRALHGGKADLALPAHKRRTVIFDFKGKSRHGPHLSRGAGSGNPRQGCLC